MIFKEPGWERLNAALGTAQVAAIGAPTLAETAIVLGNRSGFEDLVVLQRVIREFAIAVIPFGESHWAEAADAYSRFGKGKHKAALNFGDCMAYATARLAKQPLLFIGNDFKQTDIEAAPY